MKNNLINVITLSSLFFGSVSVAKTIGTQTFTPSISKRYLLVEDAMGDLTFRPKVFFGAEYNYSPEPLVVVDITKNSRVATVVKAIQTLDLQMAYFVNPRFLLGVHLPVHSVKMDPDYGIDSFKNYLGDVRPFFKIRLNPYDHAIGVGLLGDITLPTGKKDVYVSDESISPSLRILLERKFGRIIFAGHLGYQYADKATYLNLNERHRLLYALGASMGLDENDKVSLNAEVGGWSAVPFYHELNPANFLFGAIWAVQKNLIFNIGGGLGKVSGPTGAAFRALAGVKYYIDEKDTRDDETQVSSERVTMNDEPQMIVKQAPKVVVKKGKIELDQAIEFESAKSEISPSSITIVDEIAKVIKEHQSEYKQVTIEGHTNKRGAKEKNQKLSQARAEAVVAALVERGVPASLLKAKGYGSSRPVKKAGMTYEQHLEADKRVEIKTK